MIRKAKIFGIVFLCITSFTLGDEIKLKNGKVLEGKILNKTKTKILFEDLKGLKWIKLDEIKTIKRKPWIVDVFREKLDKVLKKKNKKAVLALFEWATNPKRKDKLSPILKPLYELVLKYFPDHEGARKCLGQQKINGKWYTKEEIEKMEKLREEKKKEIEKEKILKQWKEEEKKREKALQWGGITIYDQIERERTKDAKDRKRLSDFLGVPAVTVKSSMRISIQGFLSEDEAFKLLDLGEKALTFWSNELFGYPSVSPFYGRRGKFHFYLIGKDFIPIMIDYISQVHKGVSRGDRKYYKAWKLGIPPNGWDCLTVMPFEVCSMKDIKESFLVALARSFAEACSGSKLMPWLPEGFAVVASEKVLRIEIPIRIRFNINNTIVCLEQGIGWDWLGITIGRLHADPPLHDIMIKPFYELTLFDTAKCVSLISMIWEYNPKKLGLLIQKLGYKHGTQIWALKESLGLKEQEIDFRFRVWASKKAKEAKRK